MKNTIVKLLYGLALLVFSSIYAGVVPPPPLKPQDGSPGSGVTVDADISTTPINMYVFLLFVLGCMLIFYFSKQSKAEKAN